MKKILTGIVVTAILTTGAFAKKSFKDYKSEFERDIETTLIDFGKDLKSQHYNTKAANVKACREYLDQILGVNFSMSFKTKEGIEHKSSTDNFCTTWNNYVVHAAEKAQIDSGFAKDFVFFNFGRLTHKFEQNLVGTKEKDLESRENLLKAEIIDWTLSINKEKKNGEILNSLAWGSWIFNPQIRSGSDYFDGTEYREFLVRVSSKDFEGADQMILDYREDRKKIEQWNSYIFYMKSQK